MTDLITSVALAGKISLIIYVKMKTLFVMFNENYLPK